MRKFLKLGRNIYRTILKGLFVSVYEFICRLPFGLQSMSDGLDAIFNRTTKVHLDVGVIEFHTPNWLTLWRAQSILNKEPETLDWIRSMGQSSVLWDVGANIGTFTCFAAKRNNRVIAIEPSFMNLDLLTRNIISNKLTNLVTVLPIGVGCKTSVTDFYMSPDYFTWGGAHNSMGENIGSGGRMIRDAVIVPSISFTIDDIQSILELPMPTHLKVDVDGLEIQVLEGASRTLGKVNSVLIEVDDIFSGHKRGVESILKSHGLVQSSSGTDYSGSQNQIWIRPDRT
jgi:FkbM family methyltransferase